uniref:Flavin-containing monooxygenase n=1 Tax=Sphenodon punctatus TaxID=8508 RepID=A0A8D0G4U9_SPHPU
MAKKVAVIGGGSSGLCVIKCCLDEGLEPTCFESSDDIGGLWRFKEDPEADRASIYKSVIINTSKEMMCFSDYPIPEEFPNYMHNSKIMEYFRMYAKHFNLLKYIRLKTKVCSVQKRPDFPSTGQWDVVTETDGKKESSIFDGILVCTGHHTHPHMPLHCFPGMGLTILKNTTPKLLPIKYHPPSSLCLAQVFLSTRRGAWVLNRVGDEGYPVDIVLTSRAKAFFSQQMTKSMVNAWAEKRLNARFNHSHYSLRPQHRILNQHPTINDDLPNRIISGRVLVKPNIREFTETAAIFEDGTKENIDVVVFATGYSFSFPFLENCVRVVENEVSLYKFVFPPHLEKPTLAIIGLVQPLGAIMPISEMQARWATRVLTGLAKLPSASDMMADITQKKVDMAKRYVKSPRHTIQVDFVEYMDEVACQAGVKPSLPSLFLTDPKLAWEVFFGPCTPYQYRLEGPGKWDGARKAILTQQERILKPMKTRVVKDSPNQASVPFLFKLIGIVALFAVVLAYF